MSAVRRLARRLVHLVAVAAVAVFGLVAVSAAPSAYAATPSQCDTVPGNLVRNCGFETGDFTDWHPRPVPAPPGPTVNGSLVHTGSFGAQFPDNVGRSPNQFLLGTTPNTRYRITFWVTYLGVNRLNQFILFAGNILGGDANLLNLVNVPSFGWTQYTATFTTTAFPQTPFIGFDGITTELQWGLDDVVVTALPRPIVSTVPSAGVVAGGSVSDTATVTGGAAPTGSVSFGLYPPADPTCAHEPMSVSAARPLVGAGASSAPLAVTVPGTYHWIATYGGDHNNSPASSTCGEATVVTPAAPPVTCTTTITGQHAGLTVTSGTTCVAPGAVITGGISVARGAALYVDGATVLGSISTNGATAVHICGSHTGSIGVAASTGPVVIGSAADGCAANVVSGSVVATNNTGGVVIVGNTVSGTVTSVGNSGAVTVSGNHK